MSWREVELRGPGRRAVRFWCDCADGVSEHTVTARVGDDPDNREGELQALVVVCSDCGLTLMFDASDALASEGTAGIGGGPQ